jgi:uncharacterized OsmC-like protein
MKISATLQNSKNRNVISVSTEGNSKTIEIASKPDGYGSSINGGELLFLSLATCVCNDIYREAKKRAMTIDNVNVEVSGEFGKEGEAARNMLYSVRVDAASHNREEIGELIRYVDAIAEVHATIRGGGKIVLVKEI